jgi:formate hydrogenlyase subunit 6/NADH:ubiquinone oxidoreductase subunit I
MWQDLRERLLRPLAKGPMTARHPAVAPVLPPAARGLPVIDPARCDRSGECVAACPTGALALSDGAWRLDLGRCIFCGACADACPREAIALTGRIELAVSGRGAAVVVTPLPVPEGRP